MTYIPVISDVIDLASSTIQGWQKKKQTTVEANAKVMMTAAESTADWERLMASASKTSWKDEYWTVLLSIPVILNFTPGMAPYAAEGFANLTAAPDWYKYVLGTAILASFGIKAGDVIGRWAKIPKIK